VRTLGRIFGNLLKSFLYGLLFLSWGIGTAYLINGSAVLDLLEDQQMWILLGFVLVWICLFFVAGPTRPFRGSSPIQRNTSGILHRFYFICLEEVNR
jgi:hypothetical protein